MKQRTWNVTVEKDGEQFEFLFYADNKELAHAHAVTLRDHPISDHFDRVLVSDNVDEKVRAVGVRFAGWSKG